MNNVNFINNKANNGAGIFSNQCPYLEYDISWCQFCNYTSNQGSYGAHLGTVEIDYILTEFNIPTKIDRNSLLILKIALFDYY